MEGNACYKFTTIRRFVESTNAPRIRSIVDVGVNVGDTILLAREVFPEARILGFEPVAEYLEQAKSRIRDLSDVTLLLGAATSEHLYEDDLGERLRENPSSLEIHRALPSAGPGWIGGSMIRIAGSPRTEHHTRLFEIVRPYTLQQILEINTAIEIDILKLDCEGSEHSLLGCASEDMLRRVRYIVGEYHGLDRFVRIMTGKLFATHKVNLVCDPVDKELGSFFAERLHGEQDGALLFDKNGMLQVRPWLSAHAFDWHLFDPRYVSEDEKAWHGY